jgi:peroxiredoxin
VTKSLLAFALMFAACGGAGEPSERAPTRVAIGEGAAGIDATTIVGEPAPAWDVEWLGEPVTLAGLRGQVVLVRWFTQGCPYCRRTAPTLVALHDELAARGLAVIGIYHHKSDTPLVADDVRAFADELGFRFPIAIDPGWRTLDRWWMDDHPESWTSVSFLIDRRGIVRYVHTGGAYAPGSADAAQMRTWIDALLAEPS